MTVRAARRLLRRLSGAAGALGLVAATVAGIGVAGATPALAGCTSDAVTVLTVHKVDPADGTALPGAAFAATAGNAGLRIAPLTGAALTAWTGVVGSGLAAADPAAAALVDARAAADALTPVTGMGTRASLTTDASGNAHLLALQLCGYSPDLASVTLTETAAPDGYAALSEPIVVRVLRPQVATRDEIGIVSGPTGVTLSGTAVNMIASTGAPDETSSYGRGVLTVPNPQINVLPTSSVSSTGSIVVLPTSRAEPVKGSVAYTGVNVAGMTGLAAMLLAGGGIVLAAARVRRRGSREH